jgi:hypothetical protein
METATVIEALNAASARQRRCVLPWPAAGEVAPESTWWTSPELVSLVGTPAWQACDLAARRRLSFYEAAAFFSMNVHNERRLIAGARERRARTADPAVAAYLDHFAREEDEHSAMFGEFCQRYAGRLYPDRSVAFASDVAAAAGEEDFVFFARVLLFEEIVDAFNVAMARDVRLPEIVRAIHRCHHRDEARHLVFGREMVQRLWTAHAPAWPAATRRALGAHLRAFVAATGRELCSADAYRDAGLAEPRALRALAAASPAAAARLNLAVARSAAFFAELGLPLAAAGEVSS